MHSTYKTIPGPQDSSPATPLELLSSSASLNPGNHQFFSISIILLFQECYLNDIIEYATFGYPLSIMPWDPPKQHLAIVCFSLLLSGIPWYEPMTILLTIHQILMFQFLAVKIKLLWGFSVDVSVHFFGIHTTECDCLVTWELSIIFRNVPTNFPEWLPAYTHASKVWKMQFLCLLTSVCSRSGFNVTVLLDA